MGGREWGNPGLGQALNGFPPQARHRASALAWNTAGRVLCPGQPKPGSSGLTVEASLGCSEFHRVDVPLILCGPSVQPACGTGCLCGRLWGSVSVPMHLLRNPLHPHPPAWLLPSGLLPSAQSWSSVLSFHPTETSVLKSLCLKGLQHWACHHQPWADSADRVGCGFSFFGAGHVTGQRVGRDLTEKGGRFPPTKWPQLGEVSWPQLELWTDSNADLSSRWRTLLP